jgi:hypothetical protein
MSTTKEITVTTSPTLLYQSDGPDRETVIFDNVSGSDVTLGGPNVVAGHGPQLKAPNSPQTISMKGDAVYGIVATGTADVNIFAVISEN